MSSFEELEKILKYNFKDKNLLKLALRHKSLKRYKSKKSAQKITIPESSNERLEFLGDAVLKLAISEYVYKLLPEEDEGMLSKIRASVISDAMLAKKAKEIDLGKYLEMSKSEQKTGGRKRASILGDAMEAIFGAVYLDANLDRSKKLIIQTLQEEIQKIVTKQNFNDFKSSLQEFLQSKSHTLPAYRVTKEVGPDHDKIFYVQASVEVDGKAISAKGRGKNKKDAEQDAARKVLEKLCI
ncbi:ribonuclease III [Candidatus Margulisiibacteriota bacterium]